MPHCSGLSCDANPLPAIHEDFRFDDGTSPASWHSEPTPARWPARTKRLRFAQPLPRLSGVGVIEVSDRRFRERFAEHRHAVLPLLIPDHREPFDVAEVSNVELDFLPQRAGFPAVETGHVEQHAQFSVLPDESLELGHKVLVIRLCQLPADVNDENLPAVFFIELNGHLELLWFVSGQFIFHDCSCLSTVSLVRAHASSPPTVSPSCERCGEVTEEVLRTVFNQLYTQRVMLEGGSPTW